jgi:hypothetical protein
VLTSSRVDVTSQALTVVAVNPDFEATGPLVSGCGRPSLPALWPYKPQASIPAGMSLEVAMPRLAIHAGSHGDVENYAHLADVT